MVTMRLSVASRARPSCAISRSSARPYLPSLVAVKPSRIVLARNSPSEEGAKSEENPFEVPQTGRTAPMSENKRADTPEQMAAPEGDRAIAGQAWQPTEQDGKTPEDRYGSKEAAQEAAEAHKDKSRKSELQTGDTEGGYAEGGA